MSCEFARRIEARTEPPTAAERAGFEAHATACPECARLLQLDTDLEVEVRALAARPLVLPDREETSRLVRARAPEKEPVMLKLPFLPTVRRRSFLASGALVAAVTFFLLAVPIPYAHTVGQRYELQVVVVPTSQQLMALIAGLRKGFPGANLNTQIAGRNLVVEVRGARLRDDLLLAAATAAGLEVASLHHRPVREPARGTLYAQVAQRVIHLELHGTEGMTADEIAAEVRRQLDAQGAQNVDLHVDKQEGMTTIEAHVQKPAGGDRNQMLQVQSDGKVEQYHFNDLPGTTPEEKAAALQKILAEKGLKANVEIRNGQVHVERRP